MSTAAWQLPAVCRTVTERPANCCLHLLIRISAVRADMRFKKFFARLFSARRGLRCSEILSINAVLLQKEPIRFTSESVTDLLVQWSQGEREALEKLTP